MLVFVNVLVFGVEGVGRGFRAGLFFFCVGAGAFFVFLVGNANVAVGLADEPVYFVDVLDEVVFALLA